MKSVLSKIEEQLLEFLSAHQFLKEPGQGLFPRIYYRRRGETTVFFDIQFDRTESSLPEKIPDDATFSGWMGLYLDEDEQKGVRVSLFEHASGRLIQENLTKVIRTVTDLLGKYPASAIRDSNLAFMNQPVQLDIFAEHNESER